VSFKNKPTPRFDYRDACSFDALYQRYEPPEGRNRWDAPLFEINPQEQLPLEQIADYLANKRPPPPNKSTVNVRQTSQYLK